MSPRKGITESMSFTGGDHSTKMKQASEFYSVSIPVERSFLARFSQKAQRKQDIKTCALKVTFCKMPSLTSNRVKVNV